MENKDYIDPADGLLYCGKCHTPKQCRVTAFGRENIQYCICECEEERLATEKTERKQQQVAADKRQKERVDRAKEKKVDLILVLDNGVTGSIKGAISSKERK